MSEKRKKWDEEKIIKELKILIKVLKHFPTQQDLARLHRFDLQSAIGRISRREGKNYPYFQNKLGFDRTYLPDGYWTNKRILIDLKKTIIKYG